MIRLERYLRARGALDVVSVSGGKDSTAAYLLAIERGRTFRALFADTGHEHPLTYDFIRDLPAQAGGPEIEWVRADFTADFARKRAYIAAHWPAEGVPQDRVDRAMELLSRPTGVPFLDLCMMKGRFPSRRAQFCTEFLKRHPLDLRMVELAKSAPIISWIAVRWDGSANRAGIAEWVRADGPIWRYHPIRTWTADDVFALHRKHGVVPNPLYMLGMGRVGCMPCIHVRKDELAQIARRFPEEIARVAEWECLCADTSKRGAGTFFAADKAPGTPEGAPIGDVVLWATRTGRGGRQFDLDALLDDATPPPACQSLYGLCEGESP